MSYNIQNYNANINPCHHDDSQYRDEAQREVYEFAYKFMKDNNYNKIIDVGCGSGYKLINYLGEFNTIGIETEPCYSLLKNKYPLKQWILSGEPEKSFIYSEVLNSSDLVICSDVIEHIVNPDNLVNYLLSLKSKYYIISTPCRDILCNNQKFKNYYSKSWNGPPMNNCHVREWTMDEFKEYLSNYFNIISSHYGEYQIECQYHLLVSK